MRGPRRAWRPAPLPVGLTLFLLWSAGHGWAAQEPPEPCEDTEAVAVFSSPRAPQPGQPLRAIAVSERRRAATLVVVDPDGAVVGETGERRGGPPYWWYVEVVPQGPGPHRAILQQGTKQAACRTIDVGSAEDDAQDAGTGVSRAIAAAFFVLSLFFVHRSFYGMRIGSEAQR